MASQVQPVIVVAEDLYASDLMYVVAERNILCKVTSKKVTDTLFVLLATYYIYII